MCRLLLLAALVTVGLLRRSLSGTALGLLLFPSSLALTGASALSLSSLRYLEDPNPVEAANVGIAIGDHWFCDPSFQGGVCPRTIIVGDIVTWNHTGSAKHTVTQCTDDTFSTCPPPGGFDSGDLFSGDSFSQTFTTTGTTFYRCDVHPRQMRGTLLVDLDTDGDGIPNSQDSDIDGDGWSNVDEEFIGTDPLNGCTPGGWPPDPSPAPNGNGTVGIDDVFFAAGRFNASVGDGNYTARAEIASQDGTIAIDDVFGFASRFNTSC